MQRKRAGIIIFDDVEVLDFCGPFEVLSVARLDEARRRDQPSPFEVLLVAQNAAAVTTTGGMRVLPHATFDDCPPLDILVVPGGWGTRREMKNEAMLAFVQARAAQVETLTSVCTGALILGMAGLLDGLRATTHWRSLGLMQELFPRVAVDAQAQVVEDGRVLTSAGISAGIDMALGLGARQCGEAVARATARHMEYPYPESDARRVPVAPS
ncbi:MAG: DJ-1/PfpI family protein [Burkholderiales bacterium]